MAVENRDGGWGQKSSCSESPFGFGIWIFMGPLWQPLWSNFHGIGSENKGG